MVDEAGAVRYRAPSSKTPRSTLAASYMVCARTVARRILRSERGVYVRGRGRCCTQGLLLLCTCERLQRLKVGLAVGRARTRGTTTDRLDVETH